MGSVDVVSGYAVAVAREDNKWAILPIDDDALTSLVTADRQVRDTRSQGASFGLLDIDDEFFIILRPGPAGTRYFLSDATAAMDYPIAAELLEKLNVEIPDLDDDEFESVEPWAEGDFSILADLGLPEDVLTVIVDDYELFADEQIDLIAQQLGFADILTKILDED